MTEALDAAEFLARSENRVNALFALRTGETPRSELLTDTGMSQVTLGRVLDDLEDRRWIESGEEGYRLTALGSMVADSLENFLDDMQAAATLGEFAQYLPTDEYDFPLDRLASGSVFVPEPTDPNATMRAAAEQVAGSDHARILTHGFSPLVVDVLSERVLDGEMTVENVYAASVYEAMATADDVAPDLRALIEADGATFYRYDGPVPHVLAILDDRVGIGVDDDRGRPQATLDVPDPQVRAWAIATFERYRDEATLVDDPDHIPTE